MKRKLRMGMVGGAPDAFIGNIHRIAAFLDGEIELVCGAFSSNADKSKAAGKELLLNPHRVYGDYKEMMGKEQNLPGDQRMDFVSIVTPNHVHFGPACKALESGFHVIMDKPMTYDLAEAKKLQALVEKTRLVLALTHTYTGYPMVKEAKALVAAGELGAIRKVYISYTQGWLSKPLEKSGHKQASWRTDPSRSGAGGAIGDIGTHAANLAEYITGSSISGICAHLQAVIKGRRLDDDSSMLIRFDNGSTGVLTSTQVAAGEENNLTIQVYGELGGLSWSQESPNTLTLKWLEKPKEVLRTGWTYLSQRAKDATRTPPGHPEGYLEAFANIYRNFAKAVREHKPGRKTSGEEYDFPDVSDGVRGMEFIEAAVSSSKSGQKWTNVGKGSKGRAARKK